MRLVDPELAARVEPALSSLVESIK
jgi:hypothetical protein